MEGLHSDLVLQHSCKSCTSCTAPGPPSAAACFKCALSVVKSSALVSRTRLFSSHHRLFPSPFSAASRTLYREPTRYRNLLLFLLLLLLHARNRRLVACLLPFDGVIVYLLAARWSSPSPPLVASGPFTEEQHHHPQPCRLGLPASAPLTTTTSIHRTNTGALDGHTKSQRRTSTQLFSASDTVCCVARRTARAVSCSTAFHRRHLRLSQSKWQRSPPSIPVCLLPTTANPLERRRRRRRRPDPTLK